jgi:hypothetical protein
MPGAAFAAKRAQPLLFTNGMTHGAEAAPKKRRDPAAASRGMAAAGHRSPKPAGHYSEEAWDRHPTTKRELML